MKKRMVNDLPPGQLPDPMAMAMHSGGGSLLVLEKSEDLSFRFVLFNRIPRNNKFFSRIFSLFEFPASGLLRLEAWLKGHPTAQWSRSLR